MRQNRRPDAMMLEGACVMYARAVDADLMIAKHGSIIAQPILDKEGHKVGTKIRNHPALAVSNASWKQVRAFCSEFGLSPSSRTRLSADRTADDADALDQLLNGERELPDRFNKVQ